ncbi:nibrin-related [Anaeramoeba flamelloides]|uniref:Nibrin-related n=1 Tax=Anaeramoeba flamelloides TaxID=1746091 RepID=A0AAV7ZBX3_9EUKA|nr:nibrin-related [Anaeramoeba flamelloides]
MWEVLLPDETTRTLLSGARFQIGRGSQNDYQINDNTVSKRHLRFSVELNQCNVTDLSQFGTNVNGVNIRKWCSLVLEKPNYIIVGKPEKTITVRYIPICICTSNFLKNDKIKIRNLCKRYGFQFTNQSEKCTHLVMKQIGVSIKFLLSLIEAKHIVSSNWLTSILHYQKTFEWPKEEENFPIIIEEKIITEFTPLEMKKALTREKRESLFEDLHFLFLNKENYNHSHQIIKSASGQTYIFNIDDLSNFMQIEDWLTKFIKNEKIFGAKLCVVVPEKSYVKRVNSKFESVLKKFQISTILEYEIGMAVILNSTEKYCSPPQPVINKKKINQKIILNTNENTQLIENLRNPDEDEDDDEVETDIEEDGKGRGEDEDEDGDGDEDEDEDEDDEGGVQVQEEETQIISNEYLHKFNSFNKIENNVKIKQTQILSNEGLNDLDNYSKYNEEYKLKRRRIISQQNNKRTISNNNYSDSGNDTDRVNNKNDDDDDDDNDNDGGGGGSSGGGGSDSSSNNSRNSNNNNLTKNINKENNSFPNKDDFKSQTKKKFQQAEKKKKKKKKKNKNIKNNVDPLFARPINSKKKRKRFQKKKF